MKLRTGHRSPQITKQDIGLLSTQGLHEPIRHPVVRGEVSSIHFDKRESIRCMEWAGNVHSNSPPPVTAPSCTHGPSSPAPTSNNPFCSVAASVTVLSCPGNMRTAYACRMPTL